MFLGIAQHAPGQRLIAIVPAIKIRKTVAQSFLARREILPRSDVGKRVASQRQLRAGEEEAAFVRKVRVICVPLNPGTLRDLSDRRPGRANRAVKVHRRLDDPLARLELLICALAQTVRSLFSCTQLCTGY